MTAAGDLNRRIQIQRAIYINDGTQPVETFVDHGGKIWAGRRDVSDAERATAGWIEATVATRFVVRSSNFTRGLTAKDRLICEGLTFDIQGIKQLGRRDFLEITCLARADR